MIGIDRKGIVGKYPNSNRHGDPVGMGVRSPLEVPEIMNKSNEKARGKNGGLR
jgi:hypothetical protein